MSERFGLLVLRRDEHELAVEVDGQQVDPDVEAVAWLNGQAAPTVVKMSRPSPSFCPVLARTL